MEELVRLDLPNILGSEKIAIENAVIHAKKIGFSRERIEDMKTAVAEACINAIEHGNKFSAEKKFIVTLEGNKNTLTIVVYDEGNGIDVTTIPKEISNENGYPKRRGYGVFLIRNLVDAYSFERVPGGGNNVKMTMHLNR